MMNLRRIKGILLQELFVLRRSGEVLADIVIFPLTNVVVFGFLSLYLSAENKLAGQTVIFGMLLWNLIWIIEYSITLGSLWNIWTRNLTNLFISPLRLSEYILAHTLSGFIKSVLILLFSAVLSIYIFDFNLFDVGFLPLVLSIINFSLFSYALGIFILGMIFRFGLRIQAAAWSAVGLFQPLCAALYPLSVLPTALQYFAVIFPATHTFEAARYALANNGEIAWGLFAVAFLQNIVYCVLCTWLFLRMYNHSRDSGQFARNEV